MSGLLAAMAVTPMLVVTKTFPFETGLVLSERVMQTFGEQYCLFTLGVGQSYHKLITTKAACGIGFPEL
jgi:hypothetical protein